MEIKILNTASDLFLNLGFKSVTMDDLANEMGISKKTIYKYFSNKEDLVEATTTFVHNQISEMICQITTRGLNAISENFAIKIAFKNIFKKSKTSPMFQLKKYYPKTYKKLVDDEFEIFKECIGNNIENGIKEGLYKKDLKKDIVLKFYFMLVFGLHDNDIFNLEDYDLNELDINALEYHTRAIATRKGILELEKELNKINQQ
jgi:AcrR family transcriptional regulator